MKRNTADATIHFRLEKEQKEIIMQAAKESGQSLSDYARDVLLAAANYKATVLSIPEKVHEQDNEKEIKKVRGIRTTSSEWKFYQNQADRIGCSISEYIRMCANRQTITVVPGLKDVAKQIAKLGGNLNQLTMLAHQGAIKEIDLFPTNDTLMEILKQLNRIAGKE